MKIFETFKCSGQSLSNSLCQFSNSKSVPLQILHPSSVSWKITPLYLFSSNNICFGQKEIIKVKTFETFNYSGQHLSDSLCNFEMTSRFLSKFSIPIQFHGRQVLCTFLAQTIYTFFKRSILKWKFLRLSSARVKICHIPHVNFEMTSQFLFRFCIILHCHDRSLLLYFNFLDFPLLVWSYPNSWYDFWNLESVLYKFCTIL